MKKIEFNHNEKNLHAVLGISDEVQDKATTALAGVTKELRMEKEFSKKMEIALSAVKPETDAELFMLGYALGFAISKDFI